MSTFGGMNLSYAAILRPHEVKITTHLFSSSFIDLTIMIRLLVLTIICIILVFKCDDQPKPALTNSTTKSMSICRDVIKL